MVSTLQTSVRAILLAGLVGGFALATPTAAPAQAITPERALLNRVPGTVFAQGNAVPARIAQRVLDGERALLNHSQATADTPVDAIVSRESVAVEGQYPTGVKALLNRSPL